MLPCGVLVAVLFSSALLFEGTLASESFRDFGEIFRKAKLKNGNGTLRYQAYKAGAEADPKTFRFFSQDTSRYRVAKLPDVPFPVGELYSGLMPVKAADVAKQLFFVYQPSIGAPTDSLTIWLNGGPGCSSLEGFFQENGRFVWHDGAAGPVINEHAWVNATNMLWVEQPVGTGYTVGTPTARTEEEIALDFVGFYKNFQQTFGIKNYRTYVTGESYAGRYVPYISAAMLNQKNKEYFNLKGAMIVDGTIGAFDTTQQGTVAFPFIQTHKKVFGFDGNFIDQMEELHASCGHKAIVDKHLAFPPPGHQPPSGRSRAKLNCDIFSQAQYKVQRLNPCFDIYQIDKKCPKKVSPMKPNKQQPAYFNRKDVKEALHAPLTAKWTMCNNRVFTGAPGSGPQRRGDLSLDPIQSVLPQVIEATNRVLVTNGDYDMIIITNGTLMALQNMTWNGLLGFQKPPVTRINIPNLPTAGIQHFERGLMWSEAFRTGHMGPESAPELSYRHLEWLLGNRESL